MTQDQYGQARGPGNVIHGDPVPEEETDERQTDDDTKPMTRFQKVAAALRGDAATADGRAEAELIPRTERALVPLPAQERHREFV